MISPSDTVTLRPAPVSLGFRAERASTQLLTASAVIGFDTGVSSDVRHQVLAAADEYLQAPLRTLGRMGRRLVRLGAHRAVLLEDGELAMCLTVPGEFTEELIELAGDVRDVVLDPSVLPRPYVHRPIPRDPLHAARKLALMALQGEGADGFDSNTLAWSEPCAVRPVSVTAVGPTGIRVSGTGDPPRQPTRTGTRPFVGLVHVPGTDQVHVLRSGPAAGTYGTAEWAHQRLLEQRLDSGGNALTARLRREGLSYGASLRLAPSRAPYVMSASYAVPAAGLVRSLEILDEVLRLAPARAEALAMEDFAPLIEAEVHQVLTDSERAAVTFWGAGSRLPSIYRSDFDLEQGWQSARPYAHRDLRREFAVAILVGDEKVIRQRAPSIALDQVWDTAAAAIR